MKTPVEEILEKHIQALEDHFRKHGKDDSLERYQRHLKWLLEHEQDFFNRNQTTS